MFPTPRSVLWRLLFYLVSLLKSHVYTQLAPQQIKPPLPESAQTQEQRGVLCLHFKALYSVQCKTEGEHVDPMDMCSRKTPLFQQAHGAWQAGCITLRGCAVVCLTLRFPIAL